MSQSYLQAVCDGVNWSRANNGDNSTDVKVVLDSGLCAQAKAHAIAMAEKGDIFHSCPGAESVTMNASKNGKNEGIAATVHANNLLLPDIVRLGVGAVKKVEYVPLLDADTLEPTGEYMTVESIYICVVGQK